jgi:putative FmdB family regulatory protein
MPFYEYECSACKFYVEALQKVSDEPLRKCPSCKKQALRRLISVPVFRLKGGGWYETDFKSDNEQKRNIHGREEAESRKEDAKAESGDKKTAEAKPAESKAETGASKETSAARPVTTSRTKPAKSRTPAKRTARKKARRR